MLELVLLEVVMFKEGDLLMLKFGGPKMTVTDVEKNIVYCSWFDKDGKLEASSFSAGAFEKTTSVAEDVKRAFK